MWCRGLQSAQNAAAVQNYPLWDTYTVSENRENLTNTTTRTFFQTRRVMCVYSGGMDRVFILVIQLKLEVNRKYSERPTFTLTCGNNWCTHWFFSASYLYCLEATEDWKNRVTHYFNAISLKKRNHFGTHKKKHVSTKRYLFIFVQIFRLNSVDKKVWYRLVDTDDRFTFFGLRQKKAEFDASSLGNHLINFL